MLANSVLFSCFGYLKGIAWFLCSTLKSVSATSKENFFFIIIWFLRNISPVICFGSKAVYFSKNVETNIDEISPAVSMKTFPEKSKYE